jgi:hypothetical protein
VSHLTTGPLVLTHLGQRGMAQAALALQEAYMADPASSVIAGCGTFPSSIAASFSLCRFMALKSFDVNGSPLFLSMMSPHPAHSQIPLPIELRSSGDIPASNRGPFGLAAAMWQARPIEAAKGESTAAGPDVGAPHLEHFEFASLSSVLIVFAEKSSRMWNALSVIMSFRAYAYVSWH